jgi:hypothetical protein
MTSAAITWHHELPAALARAERERRFVLTDFSRQH